MHDTQYPGHSKNYQARKEKYELQLRKISRPRAKYILKILQEEIKDIVCEVKFQEKFENHQKEPNGNCITENMQLKAFQRH